VVVENPYTERKNYQIWLLYLTTDTNNEGMVCILQAMAKHYGNAYIEQVKAMVCIFNYRRKGSHLFPFV
jgi:hypothetical protein